MGLFDVVKGAAQFIGGRFDGEMSSSGSGARIRLDIVDSKVLPDPTNLVNVQVPGFKRGGRIGQDRASASRAQLSALHARSGPTREQLSLIHI